VTAAAAVALGLAAGLVAVGGYGVIARRDALGQLVGIAILFSGVMLGASGFGLADPGRAATGAVLALVVLVCATAVVGAGAALAVVARRRALESLAQADLALPDPPPGPRAEAVPAAATVDGGGPAA